MKDFFAIILICLSSNFCISQIITRGCYDFPLTIEIIDSAEYENNLELIEQQKEMEISQICFDEKLGTITKMNEREGVKMKNLYKPDNKMYMIITKDSIEYFKALYIQDLLPDLQDEEIIKAINTNTKEDSNDIKIICGIKCHKITRIIPHTLTFETYVTDRIKTNQMFLIYLPNGTMYKGTALEIVTDIGFAKLKSEAKNLITENIPDSIFTIDTLKLKPLSEMQNNLSDEISDEEDFKAGQGIGLKVYERMVHDSIIPDYDYTNFTKKNASIDLACLIYYLENKIDFKRRNKNDIDSLIINYQIIEEKLLEDYNKIFKELKIHEYDYTTLLQDYVGFEKLKQKEYRENLVSNLYYDGFQSKEEDNSKNDDKFITGETSFYNYMTTLKGIYKINNDYYVYSRNELKNIILRLISEIEPDLNIKGCEITDDTLKLVISFNNELLTYYNDVSGHINYNYDDIGERVKNEIDTINVFSYVEYEFVNMFKQIGADLKLNKVYKILKNEDILGSGLSKYEKTKDLKEFQIIEKPLFVAIDKETSGEKFLTEINYSFKNENGEVGKSFQIQSFYDADAGIEYVSIHQKRNIITFLKNNKLDFKLNDAQINEIELFLNNTLIENISDVITSIPQLGIYIDNMFDISAPKLSGKEKIKDIFPNIYKLIGSDFEANNFKIELSKNELDYILTFDAYGQNYKIETMPNKLEIEMVKKIAQIMNQKKLYKSKKLYYEFKLSLLTLKAFYLTDETKSELEKLLSFELLPLK